MMIHERSSDILLFWSSGPLIDFIYSLVEYLKQHANEIEEFIHFIFNAIIDLSVTLS